VKLPDQMNVTDEGVLKKMAEQKLKQLIPQDTEAI
jgi:hypothetical protein